MSKALETVNTIYAAFGRGDVPAILALLDEKVQWEAWEHNHGQAAGVPWLRGGTGRQAAAAFFEVVGGMKIRDFRVLGVMAGDDQVAVEVMIDADVPGGGHLRDEEVHLWNVDADGKVVRMRHYVDTVKHIAAAQGR